MRHKWCRWNLNKVHVVRGGSLMAYNDRTQDLMKKLNMKVESISDETVTFLETLILLLWENNQRQSKRVSRDKQLLFL